MRTRAKICGITRVEDVQAVADAGCDAIGFVFYPPSPRSVTQAQAEALVKAVPAYIQVVGLFVNSTAYEIQDILKLFRWIFYSFMVMKALNNVRPLPSKLYVAGTKRFRSNLIWT